MDGVRRRLGRRPLLHRLRAAARRRDDRALRGQAGRHAGRGRVLARRRASTGCRRCSPRRPRSGPSSGRTRTGAQLARTTSRPCARCSSPASGSTRTPRSGRPSSSACRSSTTGGRPRPAGRSPPTCAASSRCRSSRDRRPCRCPAATCACSTRPATRSAPGAEGAICIKLPLPPGALPTLWGDDERYVASYLSAFDGYYLTGDGGYVDEDGYLYVMGRTDDVINVAGHRLSTGSMEAVLSGHPGGRRVRGDRGARRPQGPGAARPRGAEGRRRHRPGRSCAPSWCAVRDEIGAVASFRDVDVVAALPKTRSRQDPAPHDAGDRRRQGRAGALDDRGPQPCSTRCAPSCSGATEARRVRRREVASTRSSIQGAAPWCGLPFLPPAARPSGPP